MPIEKWSEHIAIAHLSCDPQLNEDLQVLIDQAAENGSDLVLDMAQVRYINSSHIARLLKLRKLIVGGDRKMVLCALDSQVWGAFLVTGLDKIFQFAETVPTGLASLQLTRKP